jgi:hypothetical protein
MITKVVGKNVACCWLENPDDVDPPFRFMFTRHSGMMTHSFLMVSSKTIILFRDVDPPAAMIILFFLACCHSGMLTHQ